jgi:hypothetical protein
LSFPQPVGGTPIQTGVQLCPRCNYNLAGVVRPGSLTICPECGEASYVEEFSAGAPVGRVEAAWLMGRAAMLACSFCAGLVVLLLSVPPGLHEPLTMALMSACALAFGAGWYGALAEPWGIVTRTVPPGAARRRRYARLACAGLVLNAVIGAAFMAAAVVLLEMSKQ